MVRRLLQKLGFGLGFGFGVGIRVCGLPEFAVECIAMSFGIKD